MILNQILENKKREIEEAKQILPEERLKKDLGSPYPRRDFKSAIGSGGKINLIAEIKKSSPSRGLLREDFDPLKIATIYQACGAKAISVLTERRYFEGRPEYLKKIKEIVSLPLLRKDFIIDPYQIYESAYFGADAILLIALLLSKDEMASFTSLAKELGLEVMAEVHSEEDLEKVLSFPLDIIGINNRNLYNFEVDLEIVSRLKPQIPEEKIVVSESGINSYEDVMYLRSLGVNAVLIGEAFMRAEDIEAKIREVMGH